MINEADAIRLRKLKGEFEYQGGRIRHKEKLDSNGKKCCPILSLYIDHTREPNIHAYSVGICIGLSSMIDIMDAADEPEHEDRSFLVDLLF